MKIAIKKLTIQNPWWEGEALEYDPVLEEYDSKKLQWQWKVFQGSELNKDRIYLIQGTRGLGKTTLLKNLIRQLLNKQKISPNRVLYYACYNLSGFEELNDIVKAFIKDRRSRNQNKRLYLFLDEAVMVKKWQHGLKQLKKSGLLKNVTIICSGSLAEQSIEKDVEVKHILPLSFFEFLSLNRPDLVNNKIKKSKSLEYYLDAYFLTGGFPSAINDFYFNNTVRQKIYDDFLYWLLADIAFTGRDIFLARQILAGIVSSAGEPVGYKTLIRNTKAKTHLTAQDYLGILERMFGIRLVYQYENGGGISTSRFKKIYFGDPFLFWLFYCYTNDSLHYWRYARQSLHRYDVFKFLTKQVVFNHLTKLPNFPDITYWRDVHRKEEIDFLVFLKNKTMPVMLVNENRGVSQCQRILKRLGFRQGVIIGVDNNKSSGNIQTVGLLEFLLNFSRYFK